MIPTFRFSNDVTVKSHESHGSASRISVGPTSSFNHDDSTNQQQIVSEKTLNDTRSLRINEKYSGSEAKDTFRRARNLAAYDSLPRLHKLYDSKKMDKKTNVQENNCAENESIQKRIEVIDEIEQIHYLILESYNQDKEYERADELLKDQPIGKEIVSFLDRYEEEAAMNKNEDEVEGECFGRDRRGSIGSLSTNWNSRSSQQQSQLVRPIRSRMTSPAITMTAIAQPQKKKVQFLELSSTSLHEINNDIVDQNGSFIAQGVMSTKSETKFRNGEVHKGILRNSRIYRRSLSNKSLEKHNSS